MPYRCDGRGDKVSVSRARDRSMLASGMFVTYDGSETEGEFREK